MITPYGKNLISIKAFGQDVNRVYAYGDLVYEKNQVNATLYFEGTESFNLSTTAQYWDGVVEYSLDNVNWTEWDGSDTPSTTVLYLRGTGNTTFAQNTSSFTRFMFTTDGIITANGRMDYLLDYQTVEAGNEPEMNDWCFAYLFFGNNALINSPELPATTLNYACYYGMFSNCESFINPPKLPATILASNCYIFMFDNCTSLKVSETQTDEYTTEWRIPLSGEITEEATDWNYHMLANTGGTFTENPSINTTYYLNIS